MIHSTKIFHSNELEDYRAVNIGTDEITSIGEAARIICEIAGHQPERVFFDTSKPEGVHARAASVRNQESWLGWRPGVSFRDGIGKTAEWYVQHANVKELKKSLDKKLFER